MPRHVMKDAYIAINGTAVSDHCSSLTLEDKADEIDVTGFTTNSYRQYTQGFKDATITATFFSDFDSAQVNAIIQPLYASGTTFTVEVRPSQSGTVTATNPKATMTATLYAYSPIAGKVGDAATFDVAFRNAGTAGLVWATS